MTGTAGPAAAGEAWALDLARLARHRQALRIALGMASSFVLALALGWELPFLIPVLVVQFLASMQAAPGVRQILGVVVLFAAATGSAVVVSGPLAPMPVAFTLLLGLVFWFAFLLQARRRGGPLPVLLLLSFSIVPVLAVQAPELGSAIAYYVLRSGVAAILWAWLMFALLPPPAPTAAGSPADEPPPEPAAAMRLALVHTLVLMPVLVAALTFTITGVVVIVLTLAALLRQHGLTGGRRAALGLVLGNLLGGITAVAAYQVLLAAPTLGMVAALLLLIGLGYAFAIVNAGPGAPLLVTALVTFVIVFGIGVAPLLDEPGASLGTRLFYLGLACAYALVALSLTAPWLPREVVPASDAR